MTISKGTLTLTLVLTFGSLASAAPNAWTATGSMTTPRSKHTLTVLADGRALAAGGCVTFNCSPATASAEIYNPASGTWAPTGGMTQGRNSHSATLLPNGKVLVVGGCPTTGACTPTQQAELYDPATGSFTPTGSMSQARYGHAAALLPSGRVMVAGGIGICSSSICATLDSVEIYDPSTGSWSPAAKMSAARIGHTATTLNTGGVLVVGGCVGTGLPCTTLGAQIYNEGSNTWTGTGPMLINRTLHNADLLVSGRVLVSSGLNSGGFSQAAAEQYDPATNNWSPAGTMNAARFESASARLANGSVLVAGGGTATSEVYDPAANIWLPTGDMVVGRSYHHAVLLPTTGKVLAAGGTDGNSNPLAAAELFEPGTTPLVTLSTGILDFGLQQLLRPTTRAVIVNNKGGATLTITGTTITGQHPNDFRASIGCLGGTVPPGGSCLIQVTFAPRNLQARSATLNIVDNAPDSPQTVALTGAGYADAPRFWQPTESMSQPRSGHTATRLADTRILVAGGGPQLHAETYNPANQSWLQTGPMKMNRSGHTATVLTNGLVLAAGGGTSSAELFDPAGLQWTFTGAMSTARTGHAAVKLGDGKVLVCGGSNGPSLNSAELYNPATGTWSPAASMNAARTWHTATVLVDGKVLVAGGGPQSAEIYDPVANTWTPTSFMTVARSKHTAELLENGRVLVMGGCSGDPCVSAELFNPATGQWTLTGPMRVPHVSHASAVLPDGKVLVSGGIFFCDPEFGFCFPTTVAETYNPTLGTWTLVGPMTTTRAGHRATLLSTGKVLVEGGSNDEFAAQASAEVFTPQ